ncbi:MAG: tyrosine-type recombinase/integrase [Myxococcota bacterium]|nr:tyrosine-type recombinase/integrase [Myxococcota bacterium]
MKPQKISEIVHHKAKQLAAELGGGLALPTKAITLVSWASRYMENEVLGVQAENTADAKKRDLMGFLTWYYDANGHLAAEDWLPRDTQGYLNALEASGRAPTTVNRVFATLRRFARWVHEQGYSPFIGGLPTRGIRERETEEPDAKKLTARELNRLFKAADKLVIVETRKNSRPRRNRAILALLYYTGLRVSELCALHREQYDGSHLTNVKRKGRSRTRRLYLSKDCRRYLDDYLKTERPIDDPKGRREWLIVAPDATGMMNRSTVWRALTRLAEQATAHSKDDLKIHPHRLRHTFGFEVRKRTGSDTETAALLGHSGLKYVGRYVRATDEEREAILDDL